MDWIDRKKIFAVIAVGFVLASAFTCSSGITDERDSGILSYEVNPNQQNLEFYWKGKDGVPYENFERIKNALENNGEELIFAMNGGMFREDLSPQGLYIEKGVEKAPLSTQLEGYGNFYMQPNGVFYINTDNKTGICQTSEFKRDSTVYYATQSGPMLLIDGSIHPKFKNGSTNLNIRNGAGILPNGAVLFAISKEKINFYDFATFFKSRGCKNALYLDGYVSKAYCPEQNWNDLGGHFGVMIGVTKPIN